MFSKNYQNHPTFGEYTVEGQGQHEIYMRFTQKLRYATIWDGRDQRQYYDKERQTN